MGKVKEFSLKEEIAHSTNKLPNDPEAAFKKFADKMGAYSGATVAGPNTIKIKEVGPRESLSSKFQVESKYVVSTYQKGGSDVKMFMILQFKIGKKLIEIPYEIICTSEAGEKKQILKASAIIVQNMVSGTVERAYDKAVGEDYTLIGKKEKKKKKSRSEKFLDAMMDPEQMAQLGKGSQKVIKMAQERFSAMEGKNAPSGSMCYIHPNEQGTKVCDICEKPICPECFRNPITQSKLYLKGAKELKKVPFATCPNCVKTAQKKYGPKSWSQIRGYMSSH